jgi:hypothetical protein
VSFDAADLLLTAGGTAMLLHIALCAVVLRALRSSDQEIVGELFATPNQWLGLLRVSYYFPFRALPPGTSQLEPWVLVTLFAARLAGLCFACGMFGFLAIAFIEAGR